jgi:hypothetical protein
MVFLKPLEEKLTRDLYDELPRLKSQWHNRLKPSLERLVVDALANDLKAIMPDMPGLCGVSI